jgi:hypothetical protein
MTIFARIVSRCLAKTYRGCEQAGEHAFDSASLHLGEWKIVGDVDRDLGLSLLCNARIGFFKAAQQGDGVGRAFVENQPAGFDSGSGVEIIHSGQQLVSLLDDLPARVR